MNRTLLNSLVVIMLSASSVSPALASSHPLSATSNALPLLETVSVYGRITNIDGKRIEIEQSDGKVQTYRISKSRQQQYGLTVGSEVNLGIRRLNNAVISIEEL